MNIKQRRVKVPRKTHVWRDPRFIVGIALIVLSIAATVILVNEARSGIAIYQATTAIAVGEELGDHNTRVVDVRPDSTAYISAGELQPGSKALQPMVPGELITTASVGTDIDSTLRRLTVTVTTGIPDSVHPGDSVEVWSMPSDGTSSPITAEDLAAPDITVVSITEQGNSVTARQRVEILVPSSLVSPVLDAAAKGEIAILPIGS